MDSIKRFLSADGFVRIILAETTDTVEQARKLHDTTPVATAALGRTLTATVMLASELKADGSVTATIYGDGPLGRVCAVARPDGTVKAYVSNPALELPVRADGKLDVSGAVGGQGKLTVVKDLGMREPWVGQVNLISGEIGMDFAQYLTASEQQNSLVALGVLIAKDLTVAAAGGIIVQPMPGCPEQTITLLEQKAPALADISRRLHEEGGEALIASVFGDMSPLKVGETPVQYRCDCSRERIEQVLITLGAEELRDMAEQDGGAEVCCHFCNVAYLFNVEELLGLAVEPLPDCNPLPNPSPEGGGEVRYK